MFKMQNIMTKDVITVNKETTIQEAIEQRCANWTDEQEEKCLGVDVLSNPFREPGKCWVMEGKPCKYFNDYVLGPEDHKSSNGVFFHGF